jgi:hypothetical protein
VKEPGKIKGVEKIQKALRCCEKLQKIFGKSQGCWSYLEKVLSV